MTLTAPRFLNHLYSRMVEGLGPDQRAAVDAALMGDYSLLDAIRDAEDAAPAPGRRPAAGRPQRAPRGADGRHVPGTAPDHIPPPSWWRGDRAAFASSRAAAGQIEPAALSMAENRDRSAPRVGSGRLTGVT